MDTVLVTGAAGYVGSGLVGTLQEHGWHVRALVREPAPHLEVEQVVADLARDADAVAAACDGVSVVVHLAGENEVLAARDPVSALDSTVVGSERLVEAIGKEDVKRILYMSTVHVYGKRIVDGATLTEELRPEPTHPYAIARLASEHLVGSLRSTERDVVVFRLTNTVGAPADPVVDRWSLVANDLSRQGAVNGRLELHSSGMQWRDFVALRDVREMVAAACRFEGPPVPGGTYNLGSGTPVRVRHLAGLVQDAFERLTGTRPELHAPEPEADRPEPYHVSVELAARCGLQAATPLEDAVDETVRFCIENKEALAT
jgi:UDP-glucose 4-epimerase